VADRSYPDRPHVGVLAVVRRAGKVLLLQRARPPSRGLWGFPGGGQELGERLFEAAVRELREETGVAAAPVEILTVLDFIGHDDAGRVRHHWALVAVLLDWVAGEGEPIDEALAVEWFSAEEIAARGLETSPNVERVARLALAYPP
jgi:8-oxo-dGTP diphosphatase